MSYDNIPQELKLLRQWCCWRLEDIGAAKPTKVPYTVKGQLASVTDPNTWSTFEEAITASINFSGIGLVLTDNDPYAFIDLDDTHSDQAAQDRQLKVYREFDSYSEISPGGKGLHIIIKGRIPSGRRRSFIEIYSSARYATFTGNVYNDKPIAERQDLLIQLYQQMGVGGPASFVYQGDDKEVFNDKEIIDKAKSAVNGDKFNTLLSGSWQDLYQSQSEADFAFIDIVAFYTQNRNQITRIFRNSSLGKREKAKRNDYVSWMINKSFDRMLPLIDLEGWQNALNDKLAVKQLELKLGEVSAGSPSGKALDFDSSITGSNPVPAATTTIPIPPGLMGEIAQFIYQAAPRPVPEIALAGAIGLMAGVCGRAYNISGTGLNQYILCISATGNGKEAMAIGIDKLINTIRLQVPTANNFVGPSEIASGQALIKHINKTSACFVSVLGEFGLRLQSMSSPMSSSAEIGLRRILLDLYNKSGNGQMFRGSIYSDRDKNIEATHSPAFSILGESTPERFYGALNEDMISEGLLPRFMLVEYNGARPKNNKNHNNVVPSFQLIERFASLVANAEMITHAKRVINIKTNEDAEKLLDDFDKFADNKINSTTKEVLRQLWNRAHIKTLKLSALIAVGVNMSDPIVLPEYVIWSINMVQNDIKALSEKFEAGEIGTNTLEMKQVGELNKVLTDYVTRPWSEVSKYAGDAEKLHFSKVISYTYISRRLISAAAYRHDKIGATNAIKRAIQILIDSDKIREMGKMDLSKKFNTTQRAFVLTNFQLLN